MSTDSLSNTLSVRSNGYPTPIQHPPSYRRWAVPTVPTGLCEGIEAFSESARMTKAATRARVRAVWFLSPTKSVGSVGYTRRRGVRGCWMGVGWVLDFQRFQHPPRPKPPPHRRTPSLRVETDETTLVSFRDYGDRRSTVRESEDSRANENAARSRDDNQLTANKPKPIRQT